MSDVRPFRALRAPADVAPHVIAPPYDVMSFDEAKAIAEDDRSFVHVTRSEVDLPPGADSHSDSAYEKAAENLRAFQERGLLQLDDEATYYLYGQVMGEHRQVAVLAGASVAEYDDGLIKKHEYTRPDKEDDRTHHMEVIGAQVGLVFLTYRASDEVRAVTRAICEEKPLWRTTTGDGVEHALWAAPQDQVAPLKAAFEKVEALYVADGHHRSAAASRVFAKRKDDASAHFLAGLIPDDELHVLAYNRVVNDLNGRDAEAFLAEVKKRFDVTDGPSVPTEAGTFSMYLDGKWHRMAPRGDLAIGDDPVSRLDVAVLQDHLLAPVLGIEDPRRSTRIQFVGGIRGPDALSAAVDAGAAVAFHLFPTPLHQLFDVADAGEVMPPKSTWFEPKLREGVVVRPLSES